MLDNHGSHLTREFIQFAKDNQIILFPLPPHTTHFLQPLDNLPFQQYKHFHGKANDAARKSWNTFEQQEFLEALPDIQVKAFTSRTIRSSFRHCGLWPFRPSVVLDPLRVKFRSPSPEMEFWYGEDGGPHGTSSRSPSSNSSSPKTLQNLRRSINKTKAALDEFGDALDSISPKLNQKIQQIFSGSLHQAKSNAMHQRENGQLLRGIEQ